MPEALIELRPWSDVDEHDRRRLSEIDHEVDWGTPPGVSPLQFGDDVDWLVLVREQGEIVSSVGILEREVLAGGTPLVVAGIAGVMTAADNQRRGHASAAMQRAAEFLKGEQDVAFALLVCWPSRVVFYGRLGWRVHEAPVYCQQDEDRRPSTRCMQWCSTGVNACCPESASICAGRPGESRDEQNNAAQLAPRGREAQADDGSRGSIRVVSACPWSTSRRPARYAKVW